MRQGWIVLIVVFVVGYIVGVKYPSIAGKFGM